VGVNLFIEVDFWDGYCNAGMKEIFGDSDKFPKIYQETEWEWDVTFRPANFEIWRKSIIEMDYNSEMWLKGLDFLESNPDEWITSSY